MSAQPPRPPPTDIDALYGLEPVFEPDQSEAAGPAEAGTRFVSVSCPYCGEAFETLVDVSAGSASYIEDCQVCCQPIEMSLTVDDSGEFTGLSARRGD
jgi:Cysteine-rich CPXCG